MQKQNTKKVLFIGTGYYGDESLESLWKHTIEKHGLFESGHGNHQAVTFAGLCLHRAYPLNAVISFLEKKQNITDYFLKRVNDIYDRYDAQFGNCYRKPEKEYIENMYSELKEAEQEKPDYILQTGQYNKQYISDIKPVMDLMRNENIYFQ